MSLTALVSIGGVQQSSGTLLAYVGTELRGLQSTPSVPPFGPYSGTSVYQTLLYADSSGETVSFEFIAGGVRTRLAETVTFAAQGSVGNLVAPFAMSGVVESPPPLPPPGVPAAVVA